MSVHCPIPRTWWPCEGAQQIFGNRFWTGHFIICWQIWGSSNYGTWRLPKGFHEICFVNLPMLGVSQAQVWGISAANILKFLDAWDEGPRSSLPELVG